MVGWIPKLIYTQTNIAIGFLFMWIKQMYSDWTDMTVYIPTTIQELRTGCMDMLCLHWSLLAFLIEVAICYGIICGIKRNTPSLTIQASSTEKVSLLDVGSIFTIFPVLASIMTERVSLQLIFILVSLLLYEIYAFKAGCSNLTMSFLGYKEYKIVSVDNMNHRIQTKQKIRKGNGTHRVIEFNDIYLEI